VSGPNENVAWKTPIHGKAWSSPVVWGDQVWLTTATENGQELSVVCVDRNSRQDRTDRKLFDVPTPQYATSRSTATPRRRRRSKPAGVRELRLAGHRVPRHEDGEVVWQRRDFVCNHWRGARARRRSSTTTCDPALLTAPTFQYNRRDGQEDRQDVMEGRPARSTFQDIDPNTGKPQADGDWRKAFSTPRVVTFAKASRRCCSASGPRRCTPTSRTRD
jgi:hypothetical protein